MAKTLSIPLLLVACCCIAATIVSANSQIFPERLRHGKVYADALQREQEHHRRIGFTPNVTKSWFDQLIDHDQPSKGTFKDKFYYDTTYYNTSQKLCMFYLNGEGPLNGAVGGYMADLARDTGACTVSIEHRWYGESLPAPLTNKKLLTETLTVDQAMRDVRALMTYFEQTVMGHNLTWMLVGGSYSGGMTVWLNEKYPGTFKASWAASGVVRSTFAYTDYDGHVKAVTNEHCHGALSRVMRIAEHKWDESDAENHKLRKLFNIPSYNTKTDFMWAMADASASSVQYSQRTTMCDMMYPLAEDPWDALKQYQHMVAVSWGANFMASCYYSTECLANATMASGWAAGGYSWIWECCNEMAWWQIGYPESIRSRNITTSYFMNQCRSTFYHDTTTNSWAFNERHHGLHPKTNGYIIATQGSDDPWSTTGLKISQGPTFPVTTAECANCGHCGSMMSPHQDDPENLKKQREMVKAHLKEWLAR